MSKIETDLEFKEKSKLYYESFLKMIDKMKKLSKVIDQGGGKIAFERQHSKGRLTARERIDNLIDRRYSLS